VNGAGELAAAVTILFIVARYDNFAISENIGK
jgi:hypothetical protein